MKLLRQAGFEAERARQAVARLGREPRDPQRLVHGGGDVLGRILEEVAFDTSIDLDEARRALMGAWELLSAPTSAPSPSVDQGALDEMPPGRPRWTRSQPVVCAVRTRQHSCRAFSASSA